MTITKANHKLLPARPDRPVALEPRELVPVTRLVSVSSVSVINGVLTTIRVLQAA